jgi:phospholipase C
VTLSANPTSITAGGSTTLTVAAANATTVVLTGTDGSTVELPVTGGTEAVTPNQTSTYTVTATGVTGTTPATATIIVTVTQPPGPTVTIAANPQSIASGSSSVLTVTATNATAVTITGTDGSSYPLATSGGTQTVTPTQTTTYSVTADGSGGTAPATASATVTVVAPGSVKSINHVVFMLQENHTFDSYFGMLNPYRQSKGLDIGDDGNTYEVDGIDDKLATITNKDKQGVAHKLYRLKSTCIDDASSAWTESFGDESLGSFLTTRPILVNGFVSNADGFATSKNDSGAPGYTDLSGDRAMGYYDEGFLNYYYYMASQFGLSDRWFSPMSSKSIPNRIATFTGGTTQGLTQDPSSDDHLNQLGINNIFQKLDKAGVSWRVYYTVNNGECIDPEDCKKSGSALYPASTFSYLTYSYKYLYGNPKAPSASGCVAPASPSSAVGDSSNTFCIDTDKIAPLSQYFTDLANGTLPSFSFIESGSGVNDEHPGYQQSILIGQAQVAKIVNALMSSTSWKDSVFFLGYDEGGGPYDHVPPVPNHSNDKTTSSKLASYPIDIGKVAVNPGDGFNPCVPQTSDGSATLHCDLRANQPGANSGDAAAVNGFAAQLGFRVPNFVISPFTRKHYVSHTPMDHTAVIKFVEDRFIGDGKYLTARDAAQPNLLDFFDFDNTPWATPPAPPAPVSSSTLGYNPCTPAQMK